MIVVGGIARCFVAAAFTLVLVACGQPADEAGGAQGEEVAAAPEPVLPDEPPPAGKCVGWQRSLAAGAGGHAWEVERCLRDLAQRDRAAAVAEAQGLLAWEIPARAQPSLVPLAESLARFPQPGDLLAHLQQLGLVEAGRQPDAEDPPALTAEEHLAQRGRTLWFDVETGFFPNEHHLLLAELASLAGPPLADAEFVEIAPSLEEDADGKPYLLRAMLEGRTRELPAENYGDWYDLAAVLRLLNTLASDAGMATRYYTLPTGDQTAIVWAADPAAVARLVEARLLVIDDPLQAMDTGKSSEEALRSSL